MHLFSTLVAAILAPVGVLAAPAGDAASVPQFQPLYARENLCNLKSPPQLCTPNASVTVEETALRAYKFYRAFVVDGDPRTMFSLIDNVYQVSLLLAPRSCQSGESTYAQKATPPRIRQRPASDLVPVLQRPQDRNRAEHKLVLRCQHQHVVRTVLDRGQMAVGWRLCSRACKLDYAGRVGRVRLLTVRSGTRGRKFQRTSATNCRPMRRLRIQRRE